MVIFGRFPVNLAGKVAKVWKKSKMKRQDLLVYKKYVICESVTKCKIARETAQGRSFDRIL